MRNVRVVDAFYFTFLCVTVFLSTIGLSFSDGVYLALTALFGILLAVKVLSDRYSPKELLVCIVLVGLCLFLALRTRKFTVLLSCALLMGAHGIGVEKLLEKYWICKVVGLAVLFLFALIGIFGVEVVEHYRMNSGTIETRIFINGTPGNGVHLSLFSAITIFLYRRFGDIRVSHVAIGMAINIAVYHLITKSITGLLMTTGSLVLFYLCSHWRGIGKAVAKFAPFAPVTLLLTMLILGLSYGSSPVAEFVNRLATGRIAYDHYYLSSYGISAFGADYSKLITEGNFDDSFVYVLVIYGAVFSILLYGAVTRVLVRCGRDGFVHQSLFLLVYLIYSISESMYPSAVVNPSLFLLCILLFDSGSNAGSGKARCGVGQLLGSGEK